jgi:alkylation response protein AidB-like acyl-CoA dehydrogenase
LSTRAVRDGDAWVVDGQKVWTSLAQFADWSFVLCRTDPCAPAHRGISLLLVPLRQPGVEVRPIRQLTGGREFNEVFFTGARTDADLVVGPVDGGWSVAMAVLGFERGTAFLGMQREFALEFDDVVSLARRRGLLDDGRIRDRLADAYAGLEILRFLGIRTVSRFAARAAPGPEASVTKLAWSQWHQHLTDLAMEIAGAGATTTPDGLTPLQHAWLFCRQDTIAAGSSEIQRNVIGERVLGLPRVR